MREAEDCAVVLIRKGAATRLRLRVGTRLLIGRGEGADIRLDDPESSREHVELELTSAEIRVKDLNSKNGTRLNGKTLPPMCPVTSVGQTEITIGDTTILVAGSDDIGGRERTKKAGGDQEQSMERLWALVSRLSQTMLPVVLIGEWGAGKAYVAGRLHEQSPRASEPFVSLDCRAFGSDPAGALLGVEQVEEGAFSKAAGGTLLLEHIEAMPPSLQETLRVALEAGQTTALGAAIPYPLDVRLVCTSTRAPEVLVVEGTLQRGLAAHLDGMTVSIPPLRRRLEELPTLARGFVEDAAARQGFERPPELTADALAFLCAHSWPGNVWELKTVLERALVVCKGGEIAARDLRVESTPTAPDEGSERDRILRALELTGGNQTRAAELLKVSRGTLINRLQRYGIKRPRKGRG